MCELGRLCNLVNDDVLRIPSSAMFLYFPSCLANFSLPLLLLQLMLNVFFDQQMNVKFFLHFFLQVDLIRFRHSLLLLHFTLTCPFYESNRKTQCARHALFLQHDTHVLDRAILIFQPS